jgi:heme a synthase
MLRTQTEKDKLVAYWLLTGVGMIVVQTLLGGVTRLTGSGLSITTWDPIFGIVPPLNERQWMAAFNGYKQIGQSKLLNSAYSLQDFKHIFFWEWLHRFWARMLGVVFAAGFVFFLVKRYFTKQMIRPFIVLFLLGGLQGVIGWLMVASGLDDQHLYVDHIRLAAHFISAMILACYTLWFALILLVPDTQQLAHKGLYRFTAAIIAILFLQLFYGALMAGLKAATAAMTWPLINGMLVPPTLPHNSLINDKLNVQFIHRGIAYVLGTLLIFWFGWASRATLNASANIGATYLLRRARWYPFVLVVVQISLGIITVLSATHIVKDRWGGFETFAEIHQLIAMFLLLSLVVNLYAIKPASAK